MFSGRVGFPGSCGGKPVPAAYGSPPAVGAEEPGRGRPARRGKSSTDVAAPSTESAGFTGMPWLPSDVPSRPHGIMPDNDLPSGYRRAGVQNLGLVDAYFVERNPPERHSLRQRLGGAQSESAEKQTFWNEFFAVFGIRRRTVASFEEPVKKISGNYGYIDLFWPGMLLVEHKSRGKRLGEGRIPGVPIHPGPRPRGRGRTKFLATSLSPTSRASRCTTWSRKTSAVCRCLPGAESRRSSFHWRPAPPYSRVRLHRRLPAAQVRGPGPDQPPCRRHHGRSA